MVIDLGEYDAIRGSFERGTGWKHVTLAMKQPEPEPDLAMKQPVCEEDRSKLSANVRTVTVLSI